MSQMIVAARLNPKHVPQEVIERVVSDEVRAAKARTRAETLAQYTAERERARTVEKSRDRLLTQQSAEICRRIYRRRTPIGRILDRIATVYATAVGMAMCWPEVGERLGLWERIDEREEEHRDKHKRAA